MAHILGIDVAKAKLDVALRRPDGKWHSKVVENTPAGFGVLGEWLMAHGVESVHACLEATGTYWEAVAEYLVDTGHTVSVVNPAQIKAFGGAGLVRSEPVRLDRAPGSDILIAPWRFPCNTFPVVATRTTSRLGRRSGRVPRPRPGGPTDGYVGQDTRQLAGGGPQRQAAQLAVAPAGQ